MCYHKKAVEPFEQIMSRIKNQGLYTKDSLQLYLYSLLSLN